MIINDQISIVVGVYNFCTKWGDLDAA